MKRTRRYATHHVLLGESDFTIEHPPWCDLSECRLFVRAQETWTTAPAPEGWWKLLNDLTVTDPEERVEYVLVPVSLEGVDWTAAVGALLDYKPSLEVPFNGAAAIVRSALRIEEEKQREGAR